MLLKLFIKNFAIIDEIALSFENNLSVITGETGAGKSILLGALELILGKRANHSVILNKEEKCIVEAVFNASENQKLSDILLKNEIEVYPELIIRREISPNGRSRAFLNDTPVKVEDLEQIGKLLVDMHRQFDSYEILHTNEQLYIIDDFLQLNEERNNYQSHYKEYKKLETDLNSKKEFAVKAKAEQDYLEFVWNELNDLKIENNEVEDWSTELNLLENAQSIKDTLGSSLQSLFNNEQSIISALQTISKEIGTYTALSNEIESIYSRIQSTIEELKDISTEIEIQESNTNSDQEALSILQEKVNLANHLMHKHNASNTKELIAIRNQFEEKINEIHAVDIDLDNIENKLNNTRTKCLQQSEKLSKKRVSGIKKFKKEINNILPDLGFTNALFEVQHSFGDMSKNGIDEIHFLFDANNIGQLQELKKSISGGEMSRLMLAIKSSLAHTSSMPCMIFDEIDTGISGETAVKVGGVLKTLSNKHQVISITHLPQIASQANQHLHVYKEMVNKRQSTLVKSLSKEERIEEIAKMLSGKQNSKSAILAAKELLGNN